MNFRCPSGSGHICCIIVTAAAALYTVNEQQSWSSIFPWMTVREELLPLLKEGNIAHCYLPVIEIISES